MTELSNDYITCLTCEYSEYECCWKCNQMVRWFKSIALVCPSESIKRRSYAPSLSLSNPLSLILYSLWFTITYSIIIHYSLFSTLFSMIHYSLSLSITHSLGNSLTPCDSASKSSINKISGRHIYASNNVNFSQTPAQHSVVFVWHSWNPDHNLSIWALIYPPSWIIDGLAINFGNSPAATWVRWASSFVPQPFCGSSAERKTIGVERQRCEAAKMWSSSCCQLVANCGSDFLKCPVLVIVFVELCVNDLCTSYMCIYTSINWRLSNIYVYDYDKHTHIYI